MENQKDILSRLNRCCALLGVVTCDLTRSGANTDALEAVRDLLSGRITLEGFRCIVLVGGFSYADVLESARGWEVW